MSNAAALAAPRSSDERKNFSRLDTGTPIMCNDNNLTCANDPNDA
jgi:hypothetical protein